jgi:hypothetical protein
MPSSMDENGHEAALKGETVPGYETRDANTFGVLGFLGALASVIAGVLLLAWGLFRQLGASETNRTTASPFADVREVPPGPVLQVTPREDLQQTLARQRLKLETYGWENRQAGTVRIPIERAMELLLQNGMKTANPAIPNESTGVAAKPGAASGVRQTPVRAKGN